MSVSSEATVTTPVKTSRTMKAQQTDEAAWAFINSEAAAREAKTQALRAKRLAREASEASRQVEDTVTKARKTTARKATTTTSVRRSRQR